jgi:hypothetical protein
VLTGGLPWDLAAAVHFQVNLRAAGNGSLTRASGPAVAFARHGREATMDAARRIAAPIHGDPRRLGGHRHPPRAGAGRARRRGPDRRGRRRPHRGAPTASRAVRHRPRTGPAPRPGHRVQRRGPALPRLRGVGAAHHLGLRGRGAGRRRPGRRHGHRRGGHRNPRRRAPRRRRRPGPLERAAARAAAGLRGPGAEGR